MTYLLPWRRLLPMVRIVASPGGCEYRRHAHLIASADKVRLQRLACGKEAHGSRNSDENAEHERPSDALRFAETLSDQHIADNTDDQRTKSQTDQADHEQQHRSRRCPHRGLYQSLD